jgi:hypothetical protein
MTGKFTSEDGDFTIREATEAESAAPIPDVEEGEDLGLETDEDDEGRD